MSFERFQESIDSTQTLEDYATKPPFFGKDKWTIDPAKIVTRPPTTSVETPVKTTPKHVRFASYVEVYLRCPADKNGIKYPSKEFAELQQDNMIMIKDKRIEELEYKLKRARQELIRAHDYKIIIIMVSVMFIGLVMSYNYINNSL